MFTCTFYYYLLTDKLTVKYARSSGPGGQNVNKGVINSDQKVKKIVFQAKVDMWLCPDILVLSHFCEVQITFSQRKPQIDSFLA